MNLIRHRVVGTSWNEMLYADDTICISENTRTMNTCLAKIEEESATQELQLRKVKLEFLNMREGKSRVHFADWNPVKQKDTVEYPESYINRRAT